LELKTEAVVLRAANYKESDMLLTLYSLNDGKITAKISGVKKANAKLKFCTQPFCFAEFMLSKRGDFHTVTNAACIDMFYQDADINKIYAGFTALEIVSNLGGGENKDRFYQLVNFLKELKYGEVNYLTLLNSFLLNFLKSEGYGIFSANCPVCGKKIEDRVKFDFESAAFFCFDCNEQGTEIRRETYLTFEKFSNNNFDVTEKGNIGLLKLLDFYITEKLNFNIKSLSELLKLSFGLK